MNKLDFKNITLICYENRDIVAAKEAIEICKFYAEFGDIKLISNQTVDYEHFIFDSFNINSLQSYSYWVLYKMNQYINTDYCLTVHTDGFILNPEAWTNDFLNFDYIGAAWYFDNPPTVGNGGFSLRSKKLLNSLDIILKNINFYSLHPHEDIIICKQLRPILEQQFGIKFAPYEIADKFSVETKGKWNGEFGFHNYKFINPVKDGWLNPLKKG